MVVMTAKVSKAKLILAVVLVLAVVVFAIVYLKGSSNSDGATEETVSASEVNTNEDRIAFLAAYGWEVSDKPIETEAILIPEEMNEVLSQYNELQKSQGFDLTEYAGKQAKRYVYEVTNYEGTDAPVYATLLIWQGTVIGGDVTLTEGNGLMHGFTMPDTAEPAEQTSTLTTEESTESEVPAA